MKTHARAMAGHELLSRLGETLLSDAKPDNFTIARLRREAENLMQADPANAHMALGLLDGFAMDLDAMRYHFRIATQIEGSAGMMMNHATAETWAGQFMAAEEVASRAAQSAVDDITTLRDALSFQIQHGRFRLAKSTVDRLAKLTPGEPVKGEEDVNNAIEVIEQQRLDDDAVSAQFDLSGKVAFEHGAQVMGVYLSAGEGCISAYHIVRATFDECRDMYQTCAERSIDLDADTALHVICDYLPYPQ